MPQTSALAATADAPTIEARLETIRCLNTARMEERHFQDLGWSKIQPLSYRPHSIEKLFELALAIDQHVRQLALQYPAMEPAQRAAMGIVLLEIAASC